MTETVNRIIAMVAGKVYEFRMEGSIELEENEDGEINAFGEVIKFLQGFPEGSNLKTILENIDTSALSEEEKTALKQLVRTSVLKGGYKVVEVTDNASVIESPDEGTEVDVIYTNPTVNELTLTISAQVCVTPMGTDIVLLVPAGGYAEANYMRIGDTIYARGL